MPTSKPKEGGFPPPVNVVIAAKAGIQKTPWIRIESGMTNQTAALAGRIGASNVVIPAKAGIQKTSRVRIESGMAVAASTRRAADSGSSPE
jgi:hypothetical protein